MENTEYKIGQKVEIIYNENCHGFEIGEIVTLKEKCDEEEHWKAEGVVDWWFIRDGEFKPID